MKYVYIKKTEKGEPVISKKFDSKNQVIDEIELRHELSTQAVSRLRLYGRISLPAYTLEIVEATD